MSKIEAILFDLDGTLLDSAPDIRQGINAMLAEQGRTPLTLDQVKSFIGDGMMALCRKAFDATGGVPVGDLFPFVQSFITHYRKVKPDPQQIYPRVREALDDLKAKGIKMGICTNKNEGPTLYLLEQLDLLHYFGYVAGGDTFPVHKPNPGHILGVIDALGASPKNTVFVGDGPNDVVACQKAGIPCIVVTHGYSQDYEAMGGSTMIAGFDELIPAINTLGYHVSD